MLMFNMKATVFNSASYRWRSNNSKPGFKNVPPWGGGLKIVANTWTKAMTLHMLWLHLSLYFLGPAGLVCFVFLGQLFQLSQNKEHSSAP